MGNNPVSIIDPNGGCTKCPDKAAKGDTFNHPEYGEVTYDGKSWSSVENGSMIMNDIEIVHYTQAYKDRVISELKMGGWNNYLPDNDIGIEDITVEHETQWEAIASVFSFALPTAPAMSISSAGKINIKLMNTASKVEKNGLTSVGRALQKHGSRTGSLFANAKGTPAAINAQGRQALTDIITDPNVISTVRHHARYGKIIDYKLPSGQGARFSADLKKFIGFIEP